jgi:hypothetical protein
MDNVNKQTVRDTVLARIDTEGITPKPAWYFLLHEWVVWLVAVLAFIVGSVATTLSIYLSRVSWYMERQIEQSSLERLFEFVPLFWLVLVICGLFYTVHAIHETRRGYRFSSAWLVTGALGLSILLGSVAEARGVGAVLDEYLITNVPAYQPLTGFKPQRFMNSGQGVHAGIVLTATDETLTMRTLTHEDLEVTLSSATVIHKHVLLEKGVPVRVVGTTTVHDGTERFEALEINPFKGRGAGNGAHMRSGFMRENGMK